MSSRVLKFPIMTLNKACKVKSEYQEKRHGQNLPGEGTLTRKILNHGLLTSASGLGISDSVGQRLEPMRQCKIGHNSAGEVTLRSCRKGHRILCFSFLEGIAFVEPEDNGVGGLVKNSKLSGQSPKTMTTFEGFTTRAPNLPATAIR
ncbi:hypothetical protein PAAG_11238 [Paracoccidioides lutzii Pb01]|uniref:Uncharacterized protein n=1 Tax=Paracoccidioides lutzii (strain ATCC MYA-826 / Pb01) TaxID=502779 RepID=A0A0A2V6U1_PARBA|nr:hypothetical protein PAAG_11238 [Paracoccidioides lutzii Pb01]KGQ02057.1 hypothetical protein PAAG_11238 [Paracoccidioides lutzii Pb01]